MKELIIQNIPVIISSIGGLSIWYYERTKRRQELKKSEQHIQATETAHQQQIVDLYQEALTDLKTRYDEKFKDLKADYSQKFEDLQTEIKSLRTNLELWKTKYKNLKSEFEGYKKKEK